MIYKVPKSQKGYCSLRVDFVEVCHSCIHYLLSSASTRIGIVVNRLSTLLPVVVIVVAEAAAHCNSILQ